MIIAKVLEERAEVIRREAARILCELAGSIHVSKKHRGGVVLEADVPEILFDRLCLWGTAAEDLEDDGDAEDGHDLEEEDHD